MRPTSSFLRQNAVLIFFGLVFLLSWGGTLLSLDSRSLPLDAEQFTSLGPLFYLAIIAGPSVSGILMIAIVDGMPGIREFLGRLRRWRAAPAWYAWALVPALSMAGVAVLLSQLFPELRPAIIDAENRSSVLIGAIVLSLLIGSFEEIGWTGFAVPHLRTRHSVLTTGLVVGVVWGAWHFPLFWEADSFSAALPFTLLLTRLFAWLPPFRVLLIGIHEHTRSLPVVMLMHAAVSLVSIALAPQGLSGARLLISPLAALVTMWILVAAANIAERRSIAGQPFKPSIA